MNLPVSPPRTLRTWAKVVLSHILRRRPGLAISLYRLLITAMPIKTIAAECVLDSRCFDLPVPDGHIPVELFFPARDTSLLFPVMYRHAWEPREVGAVLRCMDPARDYVLLDVGANVGLFALQCELMMRYCQQRPAFRQALLFEPVAEIHECLLRNVKNAGFADALCFRVALSDEDGEAEILLDGNNIGNNSFLDASMRFGIHARERVPQRHLSRFLRREGLWPEAPVVLKLDVQGFEPRVVMGIDDDLWNAIEIALIELSPAVMAMHGPAIVKRFLDRLAGFERCLVMSGVSTRPTTPDELSSLVRDESQRCFNVLLFREFSRD